MAKKIALNGFRCLQTAFFAAIQTIRTKQTFARELTASKKWKIILAALMLMLSKIIGAEPVGLDYLVGDISEAIIAASCGQ
ncbi:hypothetical protein ACFGVR_01330 [Mucilaginibacter sp. AW1-3]